MTDPCHFASTVPVLDRPPITATSRKKKEAATSTATTRPAHMGHPPAPSIHHQQNSIYCTYTTRSPWPNPVFSMDVPILGGRTVPNPTPNALAILPRARSAVSARRRPPSASPRRPHADNEREQPDFVHFHSAAAARSSCAR